MGGDTFPHEKTDMAYFCTPTHVERSSLGGEAPSKEKQG